MRQAVVRVTGEFLCERMVFPEGTKIKGAFGGDGCVMLVVEHVELKEAGSSLLEAEPTYGKDGRERPVFKHWGQE